MKLGIFGAIGVDDIGDIVLLESALRQIHRVAKSCCIEIDFIVFGLNKDKTQRQLKRMGIRAEVVGALEREQYSDVLNNCSFDAVLKKDLNNLIYNVDYLDRIRQCSGFVFIGGGYLNTFWEKKFVSTFMIPIALGYQLGKPVYISGVNIGPFEDEEFKRYNGIFSKSDVLILRDRRQSLNNLSRLGGTRGEVILGADDALSRWYEGERRSIEDFDFNKRYGVLQLHHWVEKYSENYIGFYKELAGFVNMILDRGLMDFVYFLPFTYFKGADYECGRRLKTFVNDREEYEVLNPTDNHVFMRELIASSKFVIASRYHPVVFGLGEMVPTLGIYVNELYRQKIFGAFDVVGDAYNTIYVKHMTEGKLFDWYMDSVDNVKPNKAYRRSILEKYESDKFDSLKGFIVERCGKEGDK